MGAINQDMPNNEKNTVEQYRVDIPVTINRAELVKQFKIERTRPMMEKYLDEMIALAQPAVRAKGLYRVASVGAKGDDWVEIDGVRFNSKVLAKCLAQTSDNYQQLLMSDPDAYAFCCEAGRSMRHLARRYSKVLAAALIYQVNSDEDNSSSKEDFDE